jgi:hypothetical protein
MSEPVIAGKNPALLNSNPAPIGGAPAVAHKVSLLRRQP